MIRRAAQSAIGSELAKTLVVEAVADARRRGSSSRLRPMLVVEAAADARRRGCRRRTATEISGAAPESRT